MLQQNRLNYTLIHQIFPHVFLGGTHHVKDKDFLDNLKIHAIVNCLKYSGSSDFLRPYFKYHHVPWNDDPDQDILQDLDLAARFIHRHVKRGLNVLIHCQAGASRSPTIIVGYMISFLQMTSTYSYNYLYSKRCVVNPNHGFKKQILTYQERQYQLCEKQIKRVLKDVPQLIIILIQTYQWTT